MISSLTFTLHAELIINIIIDF